MKTPPQWDCPKQETGEDILAWAERVNRWAGYNLVEAHYADGLAGYLKLVNENRLEIRAAVLTQALCASHQRAYLAELNKPIFVPLNLWNAVTDSVPEGDEWCLCCDGSEGGGAMCTMTWWKQPDGTYAWQHLNACEHPNLRPEQVTHWMRLPEPPKTLASSKLSYGIRENEIVSRGGKL